MPPAVRADGARVVLKVGMPHMEADHEAEGLRFWDGGPIVRLIESDGERGAMLLERCEPGTFLRGETQGTQDEVIAAILRRLWRRPPTTHGFRPLSAMIELWSAETEAQADSWPDPALVGDGLQLLRELSQPTAGDVLLLTDLHAGNVLAARREPWLAIDPKPFVGDPAYDATQHLLNGADRLLTDASGVIGRFADLLDVDRGHVGAWTFARAAAEPRDDWSSALLDVARALARTL